MPTHDEIVRLVIGTMTLYGSDAADRAKPGSKLRSQAEHIATCVLQCIDAEQLLAESHQHIKPAIDFWPVDLTKFPLPD